MTNPLSRLRKVQLREVWADEARHFTPWLAQEENLALLGETIETGLELEAVEKDVGPFRADILCREAATGEMVLIENQLARTDHRHLGQVLTYAAGLDAAMIVWVASSFTEEHRATLDWLNRITESGFHFFGLEVELWRIADSPPAPKFNVVSKPNDWSRLVSHRASSDSNPDVALRFDFWRGFAEHLASHSDSLRPGKPSERHYMNFSIGKTGFTLAAVASLWNSTRNSYEIPELRAALVLTDREASRSHLQALLDSRDAIERELGFELEVSDPDDTVMKQLYVCCDTDFRERDRWPEQYRWLQRHLERMHEVLAPLAREL